MKIDREFFERIKTPSGGWTYYQIELLGARWPLSKGWMNQLFGKEVSYEFFVVLLEARFIKSKERKAMRMVQREDLQVKTVETPEEPVKKPVKLSRRELRQKHLEEMKRESRRFA